MSTLDEAFAPKNLKLAWKWIKSNPDAGYKSYCGSAYARFALADSALLDDLGDELNRGIFEPSHSTKLLLPKKSGILRPYTILTVNDQIVYQAMVNVIAEQLAPMMRQQYLKVSFGHMYAGKSSKWFYKLWQKGYSAFNNAARDAFERGLRCSASFDLTACYDSLDYSVLSHFLGELNCDEDFCKKLREHLAVWTANKSRIYHSHGIPQGPLSSGLLSEVVLRHFDLNFGEKSNVRYLRYVDDIRLFASNEDALRRTLIRLDTLSKDIGLFPQAAKINIHKIDDIESELKTLSDPHNIPQSSDEQADSESNQKLIQKEIIAVSPRFNIEDDTKFKFLLSRAHPSSTLNNRLLKVSSRRPDLVPNVMRYFRRYDRLPMSVAKELVSRLAPEPLYDNTVAEILTTLTQRMPSQFKARVRNTVRRLWARRFLAPDLRIAIARALLEDAGLKEDRIRYFVRTEADWWVRSELFTMLTNKTFGTVFLKNIFNTGIRDGNNDAAISAAVSLANIPVEVDQPLKTLNLAAARVLQQLRIVSKVSKGLDGIERQLSRLSGRPTEVNWRAVFGKRYRHAEKQVVFCRALGETDATAFVNAADVFNDLLLDRLYLRDHSLGKYTIGSVGSILTSVRLKTRYPRTFEWIAEIHEKRYISSLSHAEARKTGKPTGRIRYTYMYRAKRLMRSAFSELSKRF